MGSERVGRYEIRRVIGRGGMATVYLAQQTDLDRFVALKELALFDGSDRQAARRFLREARLVGSLNHPNIVTVHEYLENGGKLYIAMEYMPEGSLRPFVGRMSLAQVGGVLEGMLAGLAHAEERAIVHRDLKPENVMVSSQGSVKITDFGIARATRAAAEGAANLTTTGTTLGTPRYMAPERAMGQDIGPWTDLYSIGVMAFEMLVGRTPFHDTEAPMAILMRQINDPIPPVSSLVPDVDPALSDWIERLLVKDPLGRPRSASTASEELDDILSNAMGARWRRGARLTTRAFGGPARAVSSTRTTAPLDDVAARGRAARAAPSTRTTPPVDDIAVGGRAARAAPSTRTTAPFDDVAVGGRAARAAPSTRTTAPLAADDASLAATLPPDADRRGAAPARSGARRRLAPIAPPATVRRPRPRRRLLSVGRLALLAAGLTTAAVAAAGVHTFRPAAATPQTSSASAGTLRELATSAGSRRAALVAATTPAARGTAARRVADVYDRTARRLERLHVRSTQRAANRRWVTTLDATAGQYRQVATAAQGNDGAAYDAALGTAEQSATAIDAALLATADSSSPAGTKPSGSSSSSKGSGSSSSSDSGSSNDGGPDENEPDENDNGD